MFRPLPLVLPCVLAALTFGCRSTSNGSLKSAGQLSPDDASCPQVTEHLGYVAVDALSEGFGADVVFDTAGGPEALAAALGLIRPGGTVVLFAHAGEDERAGFDLNPFFKNEGKLIATYSSSLALSP